MPRRKHHRKGRASGATFFVIKVGVLCCFLILINAALCQFLCMFLKGVVPGLFDDLRMIQAIMYFGPIFLICVEFWFYDRRVDYLARLKNKKENLPQEEGS